MIEYKISNCLVSSVWSLHQFGLSSDAFVQFGKASFFSELIEHLLESCFLSLILIDNKLLRVAFHSLDEGKHEANAMVLIVCRLQLQLVASEVNQLSVTEFFCKCGHNIVDLAEQENLLEQHLQVDRFAFLNEVVLSWEHSIRPKFIFELLSNKRINNIGLAVSFTLRHEPLNNSLFNLIDRHEVHLCRLRANHSILAVNHRVIEFFLLDNCNWVSRFYVTVAENFNTLVKFFYVKLESHRESLSISLLYLLGCTEALEFAINLNCHLSAKCFSLLHWMSCNNKCGFFTLIADSLPKSSPWVWVHTRRGLVKHDKFWWWVHSNCSHELSLVSSA